MGFRVFGGNTGRTWSDQGLIAETRAYWEALREQGHLPKRSQINPRGMAGALENAFLIERIGAGVGQFRIAGLAFHDLMGMDVRGLPFSCLFLGEARMRLQMDLERMFHGPACVSLTLSSSSSYGRAALEARMALLPVSDNLGHSTLALGCIELGGAIGGTPRRFAILDSRVERITLPERPAVQSIPQAVRRIEPDKSLSHLKTPQPQSRGHLRLVHSAD